MPRIPTMQKFKGDNSVSVQEWLTIFEAQCDALDIAPNKRRNVLLVCCESSAFTLLSQEICNDQGVTYEQLKDKLKENYSGTDYKRVLVSRLRTLVFKRGSNVNNFAHSLRSTVRELYNINDPESVNAIALNHVMTQVTDDIVKNEVRLLQLAGNKSLETLMELLEQNLYGNRMKLPESRIGAASLDEAPDVRKLAIAIEVL